MAIIALVMSLAPLHGPDARCSHREQRDGWVFCPECGSRLRPIQLPSEVRVVPDASGRLTVEFDGDADGIETIRDLDSETRRIDILRLGTPSIVIDGSGVRDGERLALRVRTTDGDRVDPWSTKSPRSLDVTICVESARRTLGIVPRTVLFTDDRPRTIRLINRGNVAITLGPPRIPAGYDPIEPEARQGRTLRRGERFEFDVVRRSTTSVPEDLVIVDDKDAPLGRVRLESIVPRPPATPPGFVVSIDFGTSNTSVFAKELQTGRVESVNLHDGDRDRRETLLYAPEGTSRREWRAFVDFQEQGISTDRAMRDLKTLVREDRPGARERLAFYLESLLYPFVEEYLSIRNPHDRYPVEFVFTVPVLDGEGGDEYEGYVTRLREAAEAAGYVDPNRGWRISTVMEPEAAALQALSVLESRTASEKAPEGFKQGAKLLVIDVGGGTTDLSFGELDFSGAATRLRGVVNDSSRLEGGMQYGGEEATKQLGLYWIGASEGGEFPEDTETETRHVNRRLQDLAGSVHVLPDAPPPEVFNTRERPWTREFPNLYRLIRNAKHALSDRLTELGARQAHRCEPEEVPIDQRSGPAKRTVIPAKLLERSARADTDDIVRSISEFVTKQPGLTQVRQMDLVAIVGGGSRLPSLREGIVAKFRKESIVLFSDVDTVVCRGGTRKHDITPDTFPAGIRFSVNGEVKSEISEGSAATSRVVKSQPVNSPHHDSEAKVELVVDGKTRPLLELRIRNLVGSMEFRYEPDARRLRLFALSGGDEIDGEETRL